MKKTIRLTESDLMRIVKRIINENTKKNFRIPEKFKRLRNELGDNATFEQITKVYDRLRGKLHIGNFGELVGYSNGVFSTEPPNEDEDGYEFKKTEFFLSLDNALETEERRRNPNNFQEFGNNFDFSKEEATVRDFESQIKDVVSMIDNIQSCSKGERLLKRLKSIRKNLDEQAGVTLDVNALDDLDQMTRRAMEEIEHYMYELSCYEE